MKFCRINVGKKQEKMGKCAALQFGISNIKSKYPVSTTLTYKATCILKYTNTAILQSNIGCRRIQERRNHKIEKVLTVFLKLILSAFTNVFNRN